MILTSDIGGTNTVLSLWEPHDSCAQPVRQIQFASRELATLPWRLRRFVDTHRDQLEKIQICLAGPIEEDRCYLANLNVSLHLDALRAHLVDLAPVAFANDAQCWALGIEQTPVGSMIPLHNTAQRVTGMKAVIVPGTGLGEALLAGERAYGSEGGHRDFAARDEIQWQLYLYLRQRYGHVSYERVLAGPGLQNIYGFFSGLQQVPPPAEIFRRAQHGEETALRSYQLYFDVLAAEAANLVLIAAASGGLYFAGPILKPWTKQLQSDAFLRRFLAKGRFRPFLANVPLWQIVDRHTVSRGALRLALQPEKLTVQQR